MTADELSAQLLVQSFDFSQEELSKLCENKVELVTSGPRIHTHRGLVYKKLKSSNGVWLPRGKHALCLSMGCWHVVNLPIMTKGEE